MHIQSRLGSIDHRAGGDGSLSILEDEGNRVYEMHEMSAREIRVLEKQQ